MKTKKISAIILWAVICLGLIFVSCQRDKIPEIEIVAQVENQYLTRSQLESWLPENLPDDQRGIVARQLMDRWINTVALSLQAEKEKIHLDKKTNWFLDFHAKELLAERYKKQKQQRRLLVTDEEMSKYYQSHSHEYEREKDEVHLVQLFLENIDRAIAREIRAADFLMDVIKKNYLNNQGTRMYQQNGDLGYVVVENLQSKIRRRVKSGRTGRIYGPIKIEKGNLYFQMLDKKPAGSIRDFDDVKNDIWLKLSNIKRVSADKKLEEKTVQNFNIKRYPEHIR